eukprot:ANDGO_06285.mRNA.1 hypothetical protein
MTSDLRQVVNSEVEKSLFQNCAAASEAGGGAECLNATNAAESEALVVPVVPVGMEMVRHCIHNPLYPYVVKPVESEPIWDTRGAGGVFYKKKWGFVAPKTPKGCVPLGHAVSGRIPESTDIAYAIFCVNDPRFVMPVRDFTLVWNDQKSGATRPVAVWRGQCPHPEFVVLGNAVSPDHWTPPAAASVYAVHISVAQKISDAAVTTTTTTSGSTSAGTSVSAMAFLPQYMASSAGTGTKRNASFWRTYCHLFHTCKLVKGPKDLQTFDPVFIDSCAALATASTDVLNGSDIWIPKPLSMHLCSVLNRSIRSQSLLNLNFDSLNIEDGILHRLPYSQQCYLMTHNSTSLSKSLSIVANQCATKPVSVQLAEGIRAFKLPICVDFVKKDAIASFESADPKSKRRLGMWVAHSGGGDRRIDPCHQRLHKVLKEIESHFSTQSEKTSANANGAPAIVTIFLNLRKCDRHAAMWNMIKKEFEEAGIFDMIWTPPQLSQRHPREWPSYQCLTALSPPSSSSSPSPSPSPSPCLLAGSESFNGEDVHAEESPVSSENGSAMETKTVIDLDANDPSHGASPQPSKQIRYVVLCDEKNSPYPQFVDAHHILCETHFHFRDVHGLDKIGLRTEAYEPVVRQDGLVMIHHYILGIASGRKSLAIKANRYHSIMRRVDAMTTECHRLPTFIQFDYYNIGFAQQAVSEVNKRWAAIAYLTAVMKHLEVRDCDCECERVHSGNEADSQKMNRIEDQQ